MPLPSLPLDVWFHISTYLDPADLSSLSQVNRNLHQIATDQAHFIRHLPIPKLKLKPPSQLYRRQQALLHPPESIVRSLQMQSCVGMLSITPECLLFIDITNERLIIAPRGLKVNVEKILGMAGNAFVLGIHYSALRQHAISLPQGHVAFITGTYNTRINILNSQNGEVRRHSIPGKRAKHKLIADENSIVAAGNGATWLMFYTDPCTISLLDWRTGIVTGIDIRSRGRIVAYMRHECPSIGGMSVVGFVTEETIREDPWNKAVIAFGFDSSVVRFIVPRQKEVAMVLRSVDMRTIVLLMRSEAPENKITGFLAYRIHPNSMKTRFSGNLSMNTWPELQDNGHVLAVRCGPFCMARHNLRASNSSWQIAAVLNDDGSVESTSIQQLGIRAPPIWFRRTSYGWLVLMACQSNGWIEFVNLISHGTGCGEIPLRRWYIPDLHDICVLDDHLIFVTTLRGMLHVLHFDRFCESGRGIHACPYITVKGNGDRGSNSPEKKRRRISAGNIPLMST